jgi:DNA-binding MarR family transcriptional regulator
MNMADALEASASLRIVGVGFDAQFADSCRSENLCHRYAVGNLILVVGEKSLLI